MSEVRKCEKCGRAALYSFWRGGFVCEPCHIVWHEGPQSDDEEVERVLVQEAPKQSTSTEIALLKKENSNLSSEIQRYKNFLAVYGLEIGLVTVEAGNILAAIKSRRERLKKMLDDQD